MYWGIGKENGIAKNMEKKVEDVDTKCGKKSHMKEDLSIVCKAISHQLTHNARRRTVDDTIEVPGDQPERTCWNEEDDKVSSEQRRENKNLSAYILHQTAAIGLPLLTIFFSILYMAYGMKYFLTTTNSIQENNYPTHH